MRFQDESDLAEGLKEQIVLDKELERAKEELSLRSDFNTVDAFNVFDPMRKGHIVFYDLKDMYNQCGQFPAVEDLELVMQRYDRDCDRKWSYPEFVDAILPKNPDYAAIARGHLSNGSSSLAYLSQETSYLFKTLLRAWLECERNSERLRRRLDAIRPT